MIDWKDRIEKLRFKANDRAVTPEEKQMLLDKADELEKKYGPFEKPVIYQMYKKAGNSNARQEDEAARKAGKPWDDDLFSDLDSAGYYIYIRTHRTSRKMNYHRDGPGFDFDFDSLIEKGYEYDDDDSGTE
jgi:hypothetical protein